MDDRVSSMNGTDVKSKSLLVGPDLVPDIEAIVERMEKELRLETSFAAVSNMLLREALEARKAKNEK